MKLFLQLYSCLSVLIGEPLGYPVMKHPHESTGWHNTRTSLSGQTYNTENSMYPKLSRYVEAVQKSIHTIPVQRKEQLQRIALFIQTKIQSGEAGDLIFICTHNSRRSHMCQIWAETAAAHFGISEGVHTFSGGTEATAFNPRAVAAMERTGFVIERPGGTNPHYRVSYSDLRPAMECFSKTYDDPLNPSRYFAAVMTCSDADRNCPLVRGAALRISIPYEDPKVADGTREESNRYDERCGQIATEMFYLMSQVKH